MIVGLSPDSPAAAMSVLEPITFMFARHVSTSIYRRYKWFIRTGVAVQISTVKDLGNVDGTSIC